MTLRLPALALALGLLAACGSTPERPDTAVVALPVANDNLNAVAWSQTAVEHDLLYLETYRGAQAQLLAALADPARDALAAGDRRTPADSLPPAVVLDIDETVLDNSPYAARLVRESREYDEASWQAWCREESARALPGAVAFTQFAVRHGVAVIYISNRASVLDEATLANLRKAGLPVGGPQAFLGLDTPTPGCTQAAKSGKSCRRQLVASRYRVLMQVGDQLGDFVDPAVNTPAGHRAAVAPYLDWIGSRWFVLPNPTYGAWEPALFGNDWRAPAAARRQAKLDALRID